MRNMLVRRPGQTRSKEKGTAAIEFAIVGLWLIVLLGAIIEGGLFLLIQFELQNAADRAARLIRTNQVTAATPLSSFRDTICASVRVNQCTTTVFVDVQNAATFQALATKIPVATGQAPNVGPGQIETFNPGAPGSMGSLIITHDWQFIFPFMSVFGNQPGAVRRLYGITVFRNET